MIESHQIWSNFEEISKIYRESGHNKEISDYIKAKLEKTGFDVVQKDTDTICASRNVDKQKLNAIILQAHMDMVAISADGNPKKPIKMSIKEGWLYANDRTLGGDDGLGVAAILAIAEDTRFSNVPLEMIITTNEETGMDGARKLTKDDFYGKYLINLDSEQYGDIIKGCAGINQFDIEEKVPTCRLESPDYKKLTINLTGARGGHSATISPESLIPLKILLAEFKGKDIKLVSLASGERYNAIPRNAYAEILINKSDESAFTEHLIQHLGKIKVENYEKNPNFVFSVSSEDALSGVFYLDPSFQKNMFAALDQIPTGLLSQFEDKTSKTSQNLGVLKIADGVFYAQIMGRSADKAEGKALYEETSNILSKLFDKKISVSDSTPIWQPQPESILEKDAVKTFVPSKEVKSPIVKVEHGGLESAIFTQEMPDLEQLSIGPTIEEPHSIQERVKIDTVIPFYQWLSDLLILLSKQ